MTNTPSIIASTTQIARQFGDKTQVFYRKNHKFLLKVPINCTSKISSFKKFTTLNNLQGQPNWRKRDAHGYLPAPPQNEHGHTWHHNASDLFEMTKYGVAANSAPNYKTRMPAFGSILSDTQILAVLSFIKSQWPPAIQDQHNKIEATPR